MQTEKSLPEGMVTKRIMPETRFTEFPELSVDPRFGSSRSASVTDVCLVFLPFTLKDIIHHSAFHFTFDILCRLTTFSERHLVFFVVPHK